MKLWYINEFHIQILALELLLCRNMPTRKKFLLRLLPLCVIYITLPALVPGGFIAPFLQLGEGFTISFLLMILFSAGILWASFEISLKQITFCCCVAHTIQHMIHCLSRVIWFLFPLGEVVSQSIELMWMLVALSLIFLFLKRNRQFGIESAEIKSRQLIVFAVISSVIVYIVSFWSNWTEGNNVGEQFFDFLSCLLLLVILLDLFRFRRAEQEHLLLF